jgi:hypothetical protein
VAEIIETCRSGRNDNLRLLLGYTSLNTERITDMREKLKSIMHLLKMTTYGKRWKGHTDKVGEDRWLKTPWS